MPFAGFAVSEGTMTLLGITVAGVLGNLVGSWIAYAIGLLRRPPVHRQVRQVRAAPPPPRGDSRERWFARYGPLAVFFSRMLPIVRTFISLPAGHREDALLEVHALHACSAASRGCSCSGGSGTRLGANWEKIRPYLHYADYAVVAALVVFVVWAVWRWRKGRTRRRTRHRRSTGTRHESRGAAAPGATCRVRVPATTANIGPGFDCLGLALDLWNEVRFSLEGDGDRGHRRGTGSGPDLPRDETQPGRARVPAPVRGGRQACAGRPAHPLRHPRADVAPASARAPRPSWPASSAPTR